MVSERIYLVQEHQPDAWVTGAGIRDVQSGGAVGIYRILPGT